MGLPGEASCFSLWRDSLGKHFAKRARVFFGHLRAKPIPSGAIAGEADRRGAAAGALQKPPVHRDVFAPQLRGPILRGEAAASDRHEGGRRCTEPSLWLPSERLIWIGGLVVWGSGSNPHQSKPLRIT